MFMDKHTEARSSSNQSPAAGIFVCASVVPLNQIQKLLIIHTLLSFLFILPTLVISLQNILIYINSWYILIPLVLGKTVYENQTHLTSETHRWCSL